MIRFAFPFQLCTNDLAQHDQIVHGGGRRFRRIGRRIEQRGDAINVMDIGAVFDDIGDFLWRGMRVDADVLSDQAGDQRAVGIAILRLGIGEGKQTAGKGAVAPWDGG